jgi:hypothetical protein
VEVVEDPVGDVGALVLRDGTQLDPGGHGTNLRPSGRARSAMTRATRGFSSNHAPPGWAPAGRRD